MAISKTMIFYDAPVTMFFAVLDARLHAKKHAAIFYNWNKELICEIEDCYLSWILFRTFAGVLEPFS
jgi:hypothetical protein